MQESPASYEHRRWRARRGGIGRFGRRRPRAGVAVLWSPAPCGVNGCRPLRAGGQGERARRRGVCGRAGRGAAVCAWCGRAHGLGRRVHGRAKQGGRERGEVARPGAPCAHACARRRGGAGAARVWHARGRGAALQRGRVREGWRRSSAAVAQSRGRARWGGREGRAGGARERQSREGGEEREKENGKGEKEREREGSAPGSRR